MDRGAQWDPDDPGADPVRRAGAAVPDPRRDRVLLGLRRQVRGRAGAAERRPGARDDLVVARRARAVRRQVLAAGLAQHDRVRDRPAAGRTERGSGRPRARSRARTPNELGADWAACAAARAAAAACAALTRRDLRAQVLRLGAAGRERVLLRGAGLGERRLARLQQRVHPGERAGVQRGLLGDLRGARPRAWRADARRSSPGPSPCG